MDVHSRESYPSHIDSRTHASYPYADIQHTTMPGLAAVPPFPDDVPTHPLLVVDYQLVKQGDQAECDKLWDAATKLGFW